MAKLHVVLGYRSRKKGNFTRRIVKILPHIFSPERGIKWLKMGWITMVKIIKRA